MADQDLGRRHILPVVLLGNGHSSIAIFPFCAHNRELSVLTFPTFCCLHSVQAFLPRFTDGEGLVQSHISCAQEWFLGETSGRVSGILDPLRSFWRVHCKRGCLGAGLLSTTGWLMQLLLR